MKIQVIFFLSLFVLLSCANPSSESEAAAADETSSEEEQSSGEAETASALQIGTFGELTEITGCSCYLAESEGEYEGGEFLYAEQYEQGASGGGFAILSINGKQERLKVQTISRDSQAGKRKVAATNSDYKIYLILEEDASEESNTPLMRGVLHLESMAGEVEEKEVVGVCGC